MNKKGLEQKYLAMLFLVIVGGVIVIVIGISFYLSTQGKTDSEACLASVAIATSPKVISLSLPGFDSFNCKTKEVELSDEKEEIIFELTRQAEDCKYQYGSGDLPLSDIPWFFEGGSEQECFICYIDRTGSETYTYSELGIASAIIPGLTLFTKIGPEDPVYVGVKATAENVLIGTLPPVRQVKTRFFPFIFDDKRLEGACGGGNDVHIFKQG